MDSDRKLNSSKQQPEKRLVKYANFDEMLADAETLAKDGYTKQGKWSLGQACGHVAIWMRYPIEGFPKPPLVIRAIFGLMNLTGYTKRTSARILQEGFSGGMPTAPQTVLADTTEDQAGITQLREAVQLVKNHSGSLHPSPLFGEMDMATHTKVCLLHAEHHLGYLTPKT